MIETTVSASGSVTSWTVRPDGRRVTVHTLHSGDDPEAIAAVAAQAWRPNAHSGGRR